jgi:hypothetical protein
MGQEPQLGAQSSMGAVFRERLVVTQAADRPISNNIVKTIVRINGLRRAAWLATGTRFS